MRPEWGYALGSWAHCPDKSCEEFSSIGIFGTLPFVDFKTGLYYALVRPQGLDKRGVFLDRSVAFWEKTYPTVRAALEPFTALLSSGLEAGRTQIPGTVAGGRMRDVRRRRDIGSGSRDVRRRRADS